MVIDLSNNKWRDCGRLLAIVGMIITPVAMTLPDPYSKVLLALDAGLANAAIYMGAKPLEQKTRSP